MKKEFKKALEDIQCGLSVSKSAALNGVSKSTLIAASQKSKNLSQWSQLRSRIKKDNLVNQAIELRRQGLSLSKIARQLSASCPTVSRWCKDITISSKQYNNNLVRDPDKKLRAIQMRKDGMFITEIARDLQCAKSTVSIWLKEFRSSEDNIDDAVLSRKDNGSYKSEAPIFFKEVVDLRYSGWGVPEIASKINKKVEFVTYVLSHAEFSDKEKIEIDQKVKERTLQRRHAGELKPVGGIRQGVERSKFGYYKGIYCSSTYELCWVIYNLDHGNEVKRFDGFLECQEQNFKYYPDFIQNENEIIEIKGYEDESVARKTALAENMGYKVTLLKEAELKHMFKYVDETYGVKPRSRHTLYDNHQPVHVFCCSQCQKEFEVFKLRERHKDGRTVFCSSKCAAIHRVSQANHVSTRKIPLSETQSVKNARASGMTLKTIADKYGVSITVIQNVLKR